ncbi:MAG: hypothetical protein K2K67_02680 [Treponemataceae bacterium]|nr:hypothetical protein [Treponemataceae bacterium]
MKMTKRVLLTAAVMAVASFGFMGCTGDADDDDPNNMFSSGVNNFDIEYNNTESSVSRGVNVTAQNHKGAFIKATMDKQDGNGGVLGFMWDITVDGTTEVVDAGNTKPWSFWLIGLNYGTASNTTTTELKYYVSKYKNVTDKQAQNFGATSAADLAAFNSATGVSEYEKVKAFTSFSSNGGVNGAATITNTTDKAWTVYIDIAQSLGSDNKADGGFTVRLYSPQTVGSASKVEDSWADNYLAKIDITPAETGYTSSTIKQKQLGVYANVYGNSYVKGSFSYADTYAQAELAEADAE